LIRFDPTWTAGEISDKRCPCKMMNLRRYHSAAGDVVLECAWCGYMEHGSEEERQKGIEEGLSRHLAERKIQIEKRAKLLEKLAELEHEQWIVLAKYIIEKFSTFHAHDWVSVQNEFKRWQSLFIPYSELTEEQKNSDREFAVKVLEVIEQEQKEDG
jgi:hypothetical protein